RAEFIEYVNNTKSVNELNYKLEYDKSAISEGRLEQYANEEVAAATTLVGPHRDDFMFKSDTRELARFGSRGEQRMSVLWLKLAEMSYIEEKSGDKPTLLLDDIFSELDHPHRDQVMKVAKLQQTIITTADPHFIVDKKHTRRIEL
ncbi:MAG: replication and repair protein RecF protein, partial [Candidatus Woesebacteria bacterium GW2011_GWB1_38_5b]